MRGCRARGVSGVSIGVEWSCVTRCELLCFGQALWYYSMHLMSLPKYGQ